MTYNSNNIVPSNKIKKTLHSNTAMTTWSFLQCTAKSPNFYIFLHKVTVIPY